MTAQHINPLVLLNRAALCRGDLSLVTLEELAQRGGVENLCVRRHAKALYLSLQVSRPLLGFKLAIEALGPGLHAATTDLCLPVSSKFSDRCHLNLRL